MSGRYNFTVEQNTVLRRTFQWKDLAGTIINLTGSTVEMTAKPYKRAAVVLTPYLTLRPLAGAVDLQVPASITNTWDFSSASYDLLVRGIDDRLIEGVIVISKAQS